MLFCGIDEAGLGPLLGPLSLSRCSCSLAPQILQTQLESLGIWPSLQSGKSENRLDEQKTPEFWQGWAGKLASVADSKKIYKGSGDFAHLETLALSLYLAARSEQDGTFSWRRNELFSEDEQRQLAELAWYREQYSLPLAGDRLRIDRQAKTLASVLRQQGGCLHLSGRLITERQFNRSIERLSNKSLLLREQVGSLIKEFIAGWLPTPELKAYCTVDRLGGLRYYRPWLTELLGVRAETELFSRMPLELAEPRAATALGEWCWQGQRECPDASEYLLRGRENRNLALGFWVQGDRRNILCAIASIWAKYRRELLMQQFNQYWQHRFAGIPKTSGYHHDANSFLAFLARQARQGGLPEGADQIQRIR